MQTIDRLVDIILDTQYLILSDQQRRSAAPPARRGGGPADALQHRDHAPDHPPHAQEPPALRTSTRLLAIFIQLFMKMLIMMKVF